MKAKTENNKRNYEYSYFSISIQQTQLTFVHFFLLSYMYNG